MHRSSLVNSMSTRPLIRRMGILFVITVAMVAALLLLYQTAIAGHGVEVTITTTEDLQIGGCDDKDENTPCSLRDAIIAANSSQRIKHIEIPYITGTTTLSGTTIFTLTLQGTDEDAAKKGDLDIKKDLELTGQGAGRTIIVGLGDRVFEVLPNVGLVISGTTITGGAAESVGGAIRNRGDLQIANSVIIGNQASGDGGGIWSEDIFSISHSAIVSNTSTGGSGGGIYVENGSASLLNSTVSGNSAGGSGGGIHNNSSSLNLSYASVVSNTAVAAGGLSNAGSATYDSTIFAGNTPDDCSDASGSTISNGYNLFPENPGCSTDGTTDLNTNDALLAPLGIVPLEDGSGETYVHELLPGSPAADKIPSGTNGCGTTVVTDQRGKSRPLGTNCEIGAYEALLAQPGPIFENNTIQVVNDGVCSFDHCSLSEAILAANNRLNDDEGPDQIHFNIPGSGVNGEHLISFPAEGPPLPPITDPVIISGTTQLTGTVVLQGPLQEPGDAEGACTTSTFDGLTITGADSVISGLEIRNFPGDGVAVGSDAAVTDNGGNTVVGNYIHDNGGAGVCVDGVLGNSIRANNISTNTLGSNDPGGISLVNLGNQDQQPPILTVSIVRTADFTPTSDIGGFLQGDPLTTYDVEVFSNPSCDKAEGHTFLASTSLTTNEDGLGTFLVEDLNPLPVGSGATATATDPNGNTSEFSVCKAVETLNDSWFTAKPLSESLPTEGASASQVIFQSRQGAWFRFPVEQDGKVTLTVNGQPGTIITLHGDLFYQYKALQEADDAAALAANDLTAGFLPVNYLPVNFLPVNYLPPNYLPVNYLPDGVLTDGYLEAGYLPPNYLPVNYLPPNYLPPNYLPVNFLPVNFLPPNYLPPNFLPPNYLPSLYSGAIRRSLVAISHDAAANVQRIIRNTWDNSEQMYVFVSGPATLSEETTVSVTYEPGLCDGVGFLDPPAGLSDIITGNFPPDLAGKNTLIVWDSDRMAGEDPAGDMAALGQKLSDFAAESTVNGTVIDLAENGGSMFPRVAQANTNADDNPSCVSAKNAVATEIKRVIDAYRAVAGTSLEYVTLIGSDYVIPYFRYPDEAGLGNENEYEPPVEALTPSDAALRRGQVLGQDAYGAANEVTRSGYTVPLPDLAVGRLLRTAEQVSGMIDAYVATGGVITPGSALATGYDFVADAGQQAGIEFTEALTGTVDELITPQEDGLVGAWTGEQLRAELFDKRHDLVFMAGHFTAGSLVAADYQTQIQASEVGDVAEDHFTNSIILGLGCHGGYNIPEPDAIEDLSPEFDWPEIFLAEKATLIASTGYAYGDTDLLGYGELLFLNLIQQLRSGEVEEVAIGKALVAAKLDYFTQHPTMEGIDDKTVLETTLYGFPMLKVNMPGSRIAANEPSIVGSVAPPASDLDGKAALFVGQAAAGDQTDQLQMGASLAQADTIRITTVLTRHNKVLTDTISGVARTVTYFEGGDGVVARPAEAIFPLERRNVEAEGYILRGVGFYGGFYTDTEDIFPWTSAPSTENSRARPAFFSEVLYPSKLSSMNHVDTVSGKPTTLNVAAGQYQSDGCSSLSGTMRLFDWMDFRLYYLPENWAQLPVTDTVRLAAIAAGPEITSVTSDVSGGQIVFAATVQSDPAAPAEQVWLTWTDPDVTASDGTNSWKSLELSQSWSNDTNTASIWEATVSTTEVQTSAVFMVQAANSGGLVSQNTNDGAFFAIGALPPATLEPTTLSFTEVFTYFGAFGERATFQAELSDENGVVGGQQVVLSLGGQRACADTDEYGLATFTLLLGQSPGTYPIQASFRGSSDLALATSTTESREFDIRRQTPSLILESPGNAFTILSGEPNDVAAVLTDSQGRAMPEKTISFTASQGGNDTDLPVELKTDLDGRVALGVVDALASGEYQLTARFSGFDEGGAPGLFDDVLLYNSAYTTTVLTVNSRPVADAGGPYQVDEGSSVDLDGSGSTDEGSIVSYEWDFDYNGITFTVDAEDDLPTITFDAQDLDGPSNPTVALRVIDNNGASHIDTTTVTINNVAPTATFNAPASVDEGDMISLSLTDASDPGSADTTAGFEYAFDCGDGSGFGAFGSANNAACSTDDSGTRTVKGKIRDKDGGVSEYSGSVTVNNVVPTATFSAPASVDEGDSINLSLTGASDPSSADTVAGFEYAFDCGDGIGFGAFDSASSTSCSTNDNGVRTVRGKIRDKDGGVSEYVDTVTVNNVAPAAGEIEVADTLLPLGDPITVSVVFTDPGALDTHVALWDWGDNTPADAVTVSDGSGFATGSHTYDQAGVYTITVTITDDDGESDGTILRNVVVYESGVGKVSGGGRVPIPASACGAAGAPYCTSGGNANLAFDIQYPSGSDVLEGQTTFSFKGGSLSFSSVNAYDVLAVVDDLAIFRGQGTLSDKDGNIQSAFFEVSAMDADLDPTDNEEVDLFGIKIWYYDGDGQLAVVVDTALVDPDVDFGLLETSKGSSIKIF